MDITAGFNPIVLLYGAILIEAVVNIVRNVQEKETSWKYWVSLVLGLVVGAGVAWNFDLDLFSMIGLEGKVPLIGAILTGFILSRGSNYVSDLLGMVNGLKAKA